MANNTQIAQLKYISFTQYLQYLKLYLSIISYYNLRTIMVKRWSWEVHMHKFVYACLVVFGVIWRVSGHVLRDVRTEDEEDDLQGPNGCFPLRTLSKTIHQIKQLLSTLWNTHRERERDQIHISSPKQYWYGKVRFLVDAPAMSAWGLWYNLVNSSA